MNKVDLANRIAEKKELNKKEALEMVETVFGEVKEIVGDGEKVSIYGFGTFEAKERAERMGTNPQTKEPMKIKAKKVPKFKPAKTFRDLVENN